MALLHGRAGRLTAKNGGFRPGQMLQRTQPQAALIYATMTPFMPEKYAQDGRPETARVDVEMKNRLAVATVKAAGVSRINDLYSAVTDVCGKAYKNCTICDDESKCGPTYGRSII